MFSKASERKASVDKPLNLREQRFVLEYLIDNDAERAALAAGYAPSTARSNAFMWTSSDKQKPHVFIAIQEAQSRTFDRLELNAERVQDELAKIAFASLGSFFKIGADGQPFFDLRDVDSNDLAALSEVYTELVVEGRGENAQTIRKTKIKLHCKLDALEKLARRLRFYREEQKDHASAFSQWFADLQARGSKAPLRRDPGSYEADG